MNISEWKLAQKLQDSKHRGIIIGLGIAMFILLIVIIGVLKVRWLKKNLGCCCNMDGYEDEYYIDADEFGDDDDDNCCYTAEKDFV